MDINKEVDAILAQLSEDGVALPEGLRLAAIACAHGAVLAGTYYRVLRAQGVGVTSATSITCQYITNMALGAKEG